jgi:prepilin-type N-terminal cleavage/methylation domain-containing protein
MKKGFTFLEVMVVSIISGFLLLGIPNILRIAYQLVNSNLNVIYAHRSYNSILTSVGDDVRNSQTNVVDRDGRRLTLTYADGSTDIWEFVDGRFLNNGNEISSTGVLENTENFIDCVFENIRIINGEGITMNLTYEINYGSSFITFGGKEICFTPRNSGGK